MADSVYFSTAGFTSVMLQESTFEDYSLDSPSIVSSLHSNVSQLIHIIKFIL